MSTSTTAPTRTVKRSRARRVGESMFGALLLLRNILLGLVVVAAAGRRRLDVLGHGRARDAHQGTRARHGDGSRSAPVTSAPGTFSPAGDGASRREERHHRRVRLRRGRRTAPVALRPGTNEAVRTGPSGALHACGAVRAVRCVLAALVVAGGLRMASYGRGAGIARGGAGGRFLGAAGPSERVTTAARAARPPPRRAVDRALRRWPAVRPASAGVAQARRDAVDGQQQGPGEQRVGLLAALGGRRAGGAAARPGGRRSGPGRRRGWRRSASAPGWRRAVRARR